MKHLYLLPAAALLAASATAQSFKHPSGASPEALELKATPRAITWAAPRGGGPANDECAGAISMTVNATCVSVNATLAGATESLAPATCNDFTASAANDVWFSFTATAASTSIRVVGASTGTSPDTLGVDAVVEAFSGTCGSLTSIACSDATFPAGTTETLTIPTTPGTTYYYRVYYWPYGGPPTDYSFTTCVFAVSAPPNDDCAGAIAITPGSFCAPQLFSGAGATESLPAAACGGFTGNANDDIWFSFVATQTSMTVGAIGSPGPGPATTVYDAVVQAFSGTCASLTPIACADATLSAEPEALELTGLTVGTTYYFRVYHFYTAPADPFTVGVCVVNGTGISIGMDELAAGQAWGLFPNPATGLVSLRYDGEAGMGSIELFDATGRSVLVERGALAKNSVRALDVQALSAGVYTVRVTVNGQRSEQRLVIE